MQDEHAAGRGVLSLTEDAGNLATCSSRPVHRACLPFAGQLLSQLDAPYNPRGHNLRRSHPSRHGDQRARGMITGTVDLVREDY
jgi:hypothetical protein